MRRPAARRPRTTATPPPENAHGLFWNDARRSSRRRAGCGRRARSRSSPPSGRRSGNCMAREPARCVPFSSRCCAGAELRIVLTGAGTSAFIGECLAPALIRRTGLRVEAVPTTDLVGSPDAGLSLAVPTLLVSFARSGNSPESVAALRLAELVVPECHHLIFTCNRDGRALPARRVDAERARRAAARGDQRPRLRDDVELFRHAAGRGAGVRAARRRTRQRRWLDWAAQLLDGALAG